LAIVPEIWSWPNINSESILTTIKENRDIIKGIKLRATGALIQNLGLDVIRVAKKIAAKAGVHLMVHIGIELKEIIPEDTINVFTREMLSLLDRGDILTHIYTGKAGGVISSDGSVLPELKEAMQRGVVLDIAQADSNWSFEIATKGLEQGVVPTTISTDLTNIDIDGPVFSLPVTMSRFLAAGLTLNQLVEMTTVNPARAIGEEQQRGSLGIGMPADVSLLELTEGDFLFADGIAGKTFKGNHLLIPMLTLKSGKEIETQPRFNPPDSSSMGSVQDRPCHQ
jgi:dihydroorotase